MVRSSVPLSRRLREIRNTTKSPLPRDTLTLAVLLENLPDFDARRQIKPALVGLQVQRVLIDEWRLVSLLRSVHMKNHDFEPSDRYIN